MEPILFPSAQAVVLSALRNSPYLAGVLATHETPGLRPDGSVEHSKLPASFIRVRRDGGDPTEPVLSDANVFVECYGPTPAATDKLARRTHAVLLSLRHIDVTEGFLYRVDPSGGIREFRDAFLNMDRCQFTVTLRLRGEPLAI